MPQEEIYTQQLSGVFLMMTLGSVLAYHAYGDWKTKRERRSAQALLATSSISDRFRFRDRLVAADIDERGCPIADWVDEDVLRIRAEAAARVAEKYPHLLEPPQAIEGARHLSRKGWIA